MRRILTLLLVIFFLPLLNQSEAQQITISGQASSYANTQSVAGYTTAVDDPTLACSSGQKYFTAWYKYTASQTGTLSVNTNGSNFDTVLAVWTGARGSGFSI